MDAIDDYENEAPAQSDDHPSSADDIIIPSTTASEDFAISADDQQSTSSSDEQQVRFLENSKKCKYCKSRNVEVVFLPCGHLISCRECSDSAQFCKICRCSI